MLFGERCRKLYEEGSTLMEVANLVNSTPGTVAKYIKKSGGTIRNSGTRVYDKIELKGELLSFFIGTLLGDGTIRKAGRRSKGTNYYYVYSDKNKSVCSYVKEFLESYGFKCSLVNWKANNKTYYATQTNSRPEFKTLRQLFYPKSKGRAIVPNIIITPDVLKWWYIDDGYFCKSLKYAVISRLKKDYNPFVIKQLKTLFGDGVKWRDYVIYIPKGKVKSFLSYIGECPVDDYSYKWGV